MSRLIPKSKRTRIRGAVVCPSCGFRDRDEGAHWECDFELRPNVQTDAEPHALGVSECQRCLEPIRWVEYRREISYYTTTKP